MIINKTLELPMDCGMGRARFYHTIYVQCWVRIDKYIKEWADREAGQLDNALLEEVLTKNPTIDVNAPEEYVWKIQGRK